MKTVAKIFAEIVFGICGGKLLQYFLVGTLGNGFNWPSVLTIAVVLMGLAISHIWRRSMGAWASAFTVSFVAVMLVALAYMEP
jgi:hypothetical protein